MRILAKFWRFFRGQKMLSAYAKVIKKILFFRPFWRYPPARLVLSGRARSGIFLPNLTRKYSLGMSYVWGSFVWIVSRSLS